jgi:hypothetical protein
MEGEGPTYTDRSLPKNISAFVAMVLQSMCIKGERAMRQTFGRVEGGKIYSWD